MNRRLALSYLLDLYKLGAGERLVRAPTTYLSILFGVSQQSASRIISELVRDEYVYKVVRNGQIWIRITERGNEEIKDFIKYVNDVYDNPGRIVLKGVVERGLGEGAYYISKRRYQIQFKDKLGFYPYPGTLNIRLKDTYYMSQNRLLRSLPGFRIKGFRTKQRYFGGAKVFRAIIEDKIEGGVIYPDRSIHGYDVVEVISPKYLRGELGLKDGDVIKVEATIIDDKLLEYNKE